MFWEHTCSFQQCRVGTAGIPVAKSTFKDWDYTLGVNLGGVINEVVALSPAICSSTAKKVISCQTLLNVRSAGHRQHGN